MSEIVFRYVDDRIGELALRPLDPARDVDMLHSWFVDPKCEYWGLRDSTVEDVRLRCEEIAASPTHDDFIGLHNGAPALLYERYVPSSELGPDVYTPLPGDVGCHFLAAPTTAPVRGFTAVAIRTMFEFLFSDPATDRVIGEPDVRHSAMLALVLRYGTVVEREVVLPTKTAYLCSTTREHFHTAVNALPGGSRRSR
ncbi:GNAT family N-acetyltransferase [Lentzea jiangxiensis]|uniref:Lysine N-acyltransferase MbtK n=1 Tax=Lentzea jiangxiensis TaxID=641025 RepID=A0A1H0LZG4_9PSEU|nr:GNAT family N-acetyltransferase [Lentzea jiangxiensis]SDO73513.1 Protein N-acetyltransferase, RimJ/RimL family [Lentzea jiangxiensis]